MTEPMGTWQFQDRSATLFDETRILEEMGREGWELTSFGPFFLHFRRHEDPQKRTPWEYMRITDLSQPPQREKLERDGWTYCGSWLVLHYYKKPSPSAEG